MGKVGTILKVIDSDDRGPIKYSISVDGTSYSNLEAVSLDHGTNSVYDEGDRVACSLVDPGSGFGYIIVGLLPNVNQGKKGTDAKAGTVPFSRKLKRGSKRVGDSESYFCADKSGGLKISSGIFGSTLSRDKRSGVYYYDVYEGMSENTSASKTYSRPVRRSHVSTERESVAEGADTKFHIASKRVGLFEEQSRPTKVGGILGTKRNIELSEVRFVSHEFSQSYHFSGFEDEIGKINGELNLKQRSFSPPYPGILGGKNRIKAADNLLLLAENELTETIYGNVVDLNKNKLDINYNPIHLGSPPTDSDAMTEAKLLSRRGLGVHFQLSTNSTHSETKEYTSDKGFVFCMDKEGAFRMHVPKTSDTGNILYPISADFSMHKNAVEMETLPLLESSEEGVPVTLRDQDGKIVFPSADENTGEVVSDTPGLRRTGISYSNNSGYFNAGLGENVVSVNHTRHHNMYAAAEALIANTIHHILIPTQYTTNYWIGPGGLTTSDPGDNPLFLKLSLATDTSNLNVFEVPFPEGTERTENFKTEEISQFPQYGGTVAVEPESPAMYNGGKLIVAGSKTNSPRYTNGFSVSDGNVVPDEGGQKTGGKSANINFEGSIDVSVGADNQDMKSIVLDAAGAMIAWLGKDANGRSMIMQTDGDMLINVGGGYSGSDPETSASRGFNEGRFDLRVNVTDKGFTTTTFDPVTDADGNVVPIDVEGGDGNPLYASDYIISIGKHGMVIAGMNPTANMIIRNDGNLLIESASGDLTLKGNMVRIVEGAKKPRGAGESKTSGNASVST